MPFQEASHGELPKEARGLQFGRPRIVPHSRKPAAPVAQAACASRARRRQASGRSGPPVLAILIAGMRALMLLAIGAVTFAGGCGGDDPGMPADAAAGVDAPRAEDAAAMDGAAACPRPVVQCEAVGPMCPPGEYPEADPCPGGYCPARCWTGACLPCGTECVADDDCALVGRHGCCGPAGDCGGGCFWAVPATALAEACYFPAGCPIPGPPAGCATACTTDPLCEACPHCGPTSTRCEGGTCESVWSCEPNCLCD